MKKRLLQLGLLSLLIFSVAQILYAQEICILNGQTLKPKGIKRLNSFAHMAVLDEGRVKPIDTYAQNLLLRFSGKRRFNKESATAWFARFIFAPDTTQKDKIFLINNPEIAAALGVKAEKKRLYNFLKLKNGFPKFFELAQKAQNIDEKKRLPIEAEIIRVFNNLKLYSDLSYTFSFSFPHPDFTVRHAEVKELLGLPENIQQVSFLDIALKAETLQKIVGQIHKKKQEDWNAVETEVINLVSNMFKWSSTYQNLPFHILPSIHSDDERWYSPWDMISGGFANTGIKKEIDALRDAMLAYWNGSNVEFNMAMRTFNMSVGHRAPIYGVQNTAIPLELFYNRANLFLIARIFYGLAFLLCLITLNLAKPVYRKIAFGLVLLGFIPHASALILRMVIMSRPPVTNLYETFIFVGFVSVLLGLILEKINRKQLGVLVASICGFVFLTIAGKFSAEGDTMRVLVAVLNSNFWLSTHVISITIGYAGCCVAGVVGHVYILQGLIRPDDKKQLQVLYTNLMGILGFGITMTFLGTNLGGIWADQSWGRFWGWDPKENGALLIIIWTAIIFHAKIAKVINPLGVAVGSVLGIIVVMWAWFGVNLLSVGLHSYGFTSGLARNLAIYVSCQLLFLFVTIPILTNRNKFKL